MYQNTSAALVVAKELTIIAMQSDLIKPGASSIQTAKNVTDFFSETFKALSGKDAENN